MTRDELRSKIYAVLDEADALFDDGDDYLNWGIVDDIMAHVDIFARSKRAKRGVPDA